MAKGIWGSMRLMARMRDKKVAEEEGSNKDEICW